MKDNLQLITKSTQERKHISIIRELNEQSKIHGKIYFSLIKGLLLNKIEYNLRFNKLFILKRFALLILVMALAILPTVYFINNPNVVIISNQKPNNEYVYIDNSGKADDEFLNDLAFFESGNNYNPKGNDSYYGKYQFGRTTLDAIGFDKISKQEFITDTLLQEVAIRRLMKLNKKLLCDLIGKYEGKTLNSIYITQSGLLAAAHLGGAGNVKDFLESGGLIIFKDGNGTPITKYMKHFSGYKLHF